ncbi:hypothetical protein [Thermocrinis sp.]|jgi:hypothetical protein|uniref:hypothetical protein n=1 Tax=Thermocrinis sp. TaxID=2024383 RepID=UPI003C0883F9
MRFEDLNGQLHLRITTGHREFIYAKVLREPSNSKDKWITFMAIAFKKLADPKLLSLHSGVKTERWRSLWKRIL